MAHFGLEEMLRHMARYALIKRGAKLLIQFKAPPPEHFED